MNPRNLIVATLVLGIAVGLFFMPELTRFVSKGKSTVATIDDKSLVSTEEVNLDDASTRASAKIKEPNAKEPNAVVPLERVLQKLNSGGYDKKTALINTAPPPGLTKEGVERYKERQALAKTLSGGPINWDVLSKPEVGVVVKRAYTDANTLLKVIDPQRYPNSRLALISYTNSLKLFADGEMRKYSPREALTVLGNMDLEVTRTLNQEGAGRGLYKLWSAVSLGALVSGSQADLIKEKMYPQFKADIVLTDVKVKEPEIKSKPSKNQRSRLQKSSVQIKGVIKGEDIQRIEIYRNGENIQTLKVAKSKSENTPKKFQFTYSGLNGASGIFRVRAVSKENLVSDKIYRFLPNIHRFPKTTRGYTVEPVYVDERLPLNRRVDRAFAINKNSTQVGSFTKFDDAVKGEYRKF